MPNWCDNRLAITGSQADADELRALMTTSKNAFDFEAIVPLPDRPEGCKDWEEWLNMNWGTVKVAFESRWLSSRRAAKCDAIHVAEFATAWSPPTEIVEALSRRFPDLILRLDYNEPMWGFRGFRTYARGEVIAHKHEAYCFEDECTSLWHSTERRHPKDWVYIGREREADDRGPAMPRSKWANPFESPDRDPREAVALFVRWIFGDDAAAGELPAGEWHRPTADEIREELQRKNLLCLCSHDHPGDDSACPGSALMSIACGWDGSEDDDDDETAAAALPAI